MPPVTSGPSRAPRTLGILSIVFASLVLLSSLFSMVGLVVPALLAHAPPPRSPEDAEAMAFISRMYTGMGTIGCILAVMSSLLLALGIGQLRYRKWAALWTVRWSIVALGAVVIMATISATTFGRSLADAMALGAARSGAAASGAGKQVGTLLGAVYASMIVFFYAPYPIVLLVLFTRPRLRAAMSA